MFSTAVRSRRTPSCCGPRCDGDDEDKVPLTLNGHGVRSGEHSYGLDCLPLAGLRAVDVARDHRRCHDEEPWSQEAPSDCC